MYEFDIALPSGTDFEHVTTTVEWVAAERALELALKSSLAAHKGSIHWHFRRAGQAGTLEITWWPSGPRLWLKVATRRSGQWVYGELEPLAHALHQALLGEGAL